MNHVYPTTDDSHSYHSVSLLLSEFVYTLKSLFNLRGVRGVTLSKRCEWKQVGYIFVSFFYYSVCTLIPIKRVSESCEGKFKWVLQAGPTCPWYSVRGELDIPLLTLHLPNYSSIRRFLEMF